MEKMYKLKLKWLRQLKENKTISYFHLEELKELETIEKLDNESKYPPTCSNCSSNLDSYIEICPTCKKAVIHE